MAEFNILDHIKKLTPDGGSAGPGEQSFHCPVCEAENFKVNLKTGKWSAFSCDCASTEDGKRRIRNALSPAINPNKKDPRPKQHRAWDYHDINGNYLFTVHRWDDPFTTDKRFSNGRCIRQTFSPAWEDDIDRQQWRNEAGQRPADLGHLAIPYGLKEATQALADGAPWVLWVEGEPCVDSLRRLGIPATTSLGGCSNFNPERDAGHIPPDRLVAVPDRDKPGLKYAKQVADAHPGCQWLYPFPGTPQWNGSCPPDGGLDIADWIAQGATVDQILDGIGPKTEPKPVVTSAEPATIDELLGPVEEGKLRRPRTDLLTKVIGLALPLRFNLLTQRIENDGEPIDGDFLGTLYLQLAEHYQLEVSKDRACDAATLVARRNAYHPVRDYLNAIPVQLDATDWDNIALKVFNVADPLPQLHLQRQLIGLVARAMDPGCKLDTALVVHSPKQGIGKSTVWAILGGEWFSDSLGDLRNLKDDILQLHSSWIHEWGEIDAVVGKRESETLKKFLSARRDDVRKPYGRGVDSLKRSCGVVGTTNRSDFIKDPTGNRRFPVISVTTVNTEWVTANRDAIWGSALAAYKAGTQWHYTEEENDQITAAALAYAAEDPLRDQIESWIEDHPDVESISTPSLIYQLDPEQLRSQEFARQVSMRLISLGWARAPKRERGFLPNGDRHDKATFWERPSTAPGTAPEIEGTAPENPAHCPTTAPALPHPTAQQSYQGISENWGSGGSGNQGSLEGGLNGQNGAPEGSANIPVFRKENTAPLPHCPNPPLWEPLDESTLDF